MTKLKPGRELDALIAEKVMGIFNRDSNIGILGPTPDSLPFYSTDISAAWQVVGKMKNKSNYRAPDSYFTVQRLEEENWRAGYMEFIDWVLQEDGDTAPHAICLAALKAVGYGND